MKGKVQRGLAYLKKFISIFSQSQSSNVYHQLVENHILYADIIWGSLSDSKKESPRRLHHRAMSLIDKSRIKDDWSNKFLQVGQLAKFDRAVMTYKIVNGFSPEKLLNKFQ